MLIDLLTREPQAVIGIVQGTPLWVWALLAALLALGASQLRDRWVSRRRLLLLPVAMVLLSLVGLISAFQATPLLAATLALWTVAGGLAYGLMHVSLPALTLPRDEQAQQVRVPGSAVPLVLIAAIFLLKWGVGVEMALQPGVVHSTAFACSVAVAYGLMSGAFAARAGRLLRAA